MLDTYEDESGFRPDNESDVMLRMRVLAGEIFTEQAYAAFILRQMFPTTAVGEYLDAHAAQRGLTRKGGVKATGTVTFSALAEEHGDIAIPAGTVVSTKVDMRRFVTDSDVVIAATAESAEAAVTAAEIGKDYNVTADTVGIIVMPVLGVGSVTNDAGFSGGADAESDELLRERVIDSYRNISNGANAAYYRGVALSVDGVYSASVVGCGRGAGTVDVYVSGRGAELPAAKLQEVQALLDEKREVNVDVRAFGATELIVTLYIRLTVSEGYVFSTVANTVRDAVIDYINGLGIGKDLRLSNVGEVIYHIEGVSGYKFLESFGSDREIPPTRYAKAGTILVRDD